MFLNTNFHFLYSAGSLRFKIKAWIFNFRSRQMGNICFASAAFLFGEFAGVEIGLLRRRNVPPLPFTSPLLQETKQRPASRTPLITTSGFYFLPLGGRRRSKMAAR